MRRALVVVAIAGCAGTHEAGPVSRDELAQRLGSASAIDLAKMMRAPVGYGGLWFDDPSCQAQFIAPGMIGSDRIDAFARCVAGLHLAASPRKSPFPDVMVLDYAPGFEVEAEFQVRDTTAIRWIGYAGRHDVRDALPAVTPSALEALRIAGAARPTPSAADEARLARERAELAIDQSNAWLKVCIDGDGNVTGAHPREESSPVAGEVFSAAVMQWKFRPFVVGGRALPVCALVAMADPPLDPASAQARDLPHPVPADLGSVIVSSAALHRVAGNVQVHPDDHLAFTIASGGGGALYASFAFCIDERGDVSAVAPLRKTGLASYDDKLEAAIRTWKYEPFVVEGKAIPACAAITFIYDSQPLT